MQVIMAMTDPLDGAGDGSPEMLPICDDARAKLGTPSVAGWAMHQAAAAGRRGTSIAGNLGASLRSVLTDVGKVTDVLSFTRSDAAMLAKLGSGLAADRNLLQGQARRGQAAVLDQAGAGGGRQGRGPRHRRYRQ